MQIKGLVKKYPNLDKDSIFLSLHSEAKNLEVRISPHFGSNIYKFKYNGFDIFYSDLKLLKKRDWTGCFILWPLPNRVRNKKYEFEGKQYDLSKLKRNGNDPHLIHGLVDDKVWKIGKISKDKNSVSAETYIEVLPDTKIYKYFPFKSRLTLKFILSPTGLKVEYKIKNLSASNLPFGFALHPYFPKNSNSSPLIYLPVKKLMQAGNALLPSGKLTHLKSVGLNFTSPLPVSKLSLDSVFTNLINGKKPFIDFQDRNIKIIIDSSSDFTHVVLYTKPKDYFCFENQTGSTDMINLYTKSIKTKNKSLQKAAHLLVLPPQKEYSGFIEYKIVDY